MALAAFVWATGMGIWTFYGLTRDHNYPFPSLADAGFLAYCVPAGVALFSFTRPGGSRVALLRTVMDAAVISCAVLIVSWYTVLGPVFSSESDDLLARLTGLAYPVVDVIMTRWSWCSRCAGSPGNGCLGSVSAAACLC